MIQFFKKFKRYITKRNIIITVCIAAVVSSCVGAALFADKEPTVAVSQPDTVESSLVQDLEVSDATVSETEKEFEITTPKKDSVSTTEPTYLISGVSDKGEELLMNGKAVEQNEDGSFSVRVELKAGKNTFKFEHKGQTVTKVIEYRYVVIESFEPAGNKTYSSGSVISVNVNARNGSKVTASFNGKTVTCKQQSLQADDDETNKSDTFCNYTGTFKLPENNNKNINLGKIKITANCGGVTETRYSGDITVKKSSIVKGSDPSVTPSGGNYIDVGSGLIATVVSRTAETFNGKTSDDDSNPANNYLPEGTMDYCAEGLVTYGKKEYYKLRCGRRVYKNSNPGYSYNQQVVSVKEGTLPDHNELNICSFESEGQYTTLKLDTNWKAPFYFELLKQSYKQSSKGYDVSSVTFSYVDITFCYATVLTGDITIPENHPIFKSAEIIKNDNDYTIRLHLKKTGGFYGWDCYYDNNGKLTFEFLNPVKMENENSLSGAKIFIDVGHGGSDVGAIVSNTKEAERNLFLANKIKSRLEALGAEVIMSRTKSGTYISPPDRMNMLRDADADFCVAIHHDASIYSSPNGFLSAYFSPYSKVAAEFISQRTENAGIYNKIRDVNSHYYYVSRVTNCPVVLTENGYITNSNDLIGIKSSSVNDKKAEAIVAGILDYFRSIQ